MTPDNSNRAEPHADTDLHDDLVAGLGRRLAASRPVRARRRPFFAELRAATLEQYEADSTACDALEALD